MRGALRSLRRREPPPEAGPLTSVDGSTRTLGVRGQTTTTTPSLGKPWVRPCVKKNIFPTFSHAESVINY